MEVRWVVVMFGYPEYDQSGEFEAIVGIYESKEDADEVSSRHDNSIVVEAPYYSA